MIDFIANHLEACHEETWIKLRDACSENDHQAARKILESLGPEIDSIVNTTPGGSNTLLFSASEKGHERVVRLLVEFKADGRIHPVTQYSPLYIACYHGRLSIVKFLLSKFPALVNVETVEKWLPIHGAAINNHVAIVQELLEFSYPPEVMINFVHHTGLYEYSFAFDINAQDVTGKSPLYIASFLGNQGLVELLLKFRRSGRPISQDKSKDEGDLEILPNQSPVKKNCNLLQSNRSPSSTIHRDLSPSSSFIVTRLGHESSDASSNDPQYNLPKISTVHIDIYCNYGTETSLHISIKRKHYTIASLLLQYGADPNLPILPAQDSDPIENESGKTSPSTCLSEACKLREASLVDLLVRFGARDDQSLALEIAAESRDNHLISKLLSLKSFPDPEYKIYKKAMEFNGFSTATNSVSVTVSSIFPSVPVMINWYSIKFLHHIEKQWLINACIAHNIKFKLNSQNQAIVLNAITRLDLSSNNFTCVPFCIFQLPSLRVLNLSSNLLSSLPEIENDQFTSTGTAMKKSRSFLTNMSKVSQSKCMWFLPCLEELYLQNNRIEFLTPCLFELPSLQLLDLSNNRITTLPNRLWSAPKLRDLNLSSNLLRELPLKLLPVICSSFKDKPNHDDFLASSEEEYESYRPSELLKPKILNHINLWDKEVQIVSGPYIDDSENSAHQLPLNSLNLSHNAFSEIPENLSCLAVNLSRLNMSHNYLKSIEDLKLFPANLKHLDLSHNQIRKWAASSYDSSDEACKHSICYGILCSNESSSALKISKASKKTKYCIHKQHVRLDSLKTIIISHNQLTNVMVVAKELDDFENLEIDSRNTRPQIRTIFPNLSMLDISYNQLEEITPRISELNHLSVLNISGNFKINHLPPEMGLLSKLWNLSTAGCNLGEPLKTMIDSKKYKTMDIIGYLKSILENSRLYARMKLMLVGVHNIGKSSLLELLRQEGTGSYRKRPPEHWAKRMGKQNVGIKTPKGVTLSTVGVDVCDWTYEKKVRNQPSYGPVTFRTWDFGGQKEYYATHQYFLSKRSLYLLLWKMIDGEKAIEDIQQWLVNIQARAPNAPVIIVGTHHDLMGEHYPRLYSEYLQQIIRDRFINIIDPDKLGLPKVVDSIEISIKTRHNIKKLCNLIYDTVFELRSPGSKEKLLEQKVPATYLALEEVVGHLANERLAEGKDPVLVGDKYRLKVSSEMMRRFGLAFRDAAELRQATVFLHENGVLLHYEDATLKDLYFLDPQWLCDQLATVVTIREINPYAKNGIMKTDDLKHLFKSSDLSQSDIKYYIINLLNKFEVALTWDSRTLMIPSLLPTENAMLAEGPNGGVHVSLKNQQGELFPRFLLLQIPIKAKSWSSRSKFSALNPESDPKISNSPIKEITPTVTLVNRTDKTIHRLLLMTYFPSGFWSRLMTRVLAEDIVGDIVRNFYRVVNEKKTDPVLQSYLATKPKWICWQSGFALQHLSHQIFSVKEITLSIENPLFEYYQQNPFLIKQENSWVDVQVAKSSILEILLPNHLLRVSTPTSTYILEPNIEFCAKLLALTVDHIDTLLEDWYPTLGTRFVHTSEGKFLVTRMVPCTKCLLASEEFGDGASITASSNLFDSSGPRHSPNCAPAVEIQTWWEASTSRERGSNIGSVKSNNSQDSGVDNESSVSSRNESLDNSKAAASRIKKLDIPAITGKKKSVIYSFIIEECIMLASQEKTVECPVHGKLNLKEITPDLMFLDLGEQHLIRSEAIKRGKMLGRGAFGFVFRATIRKKSSVLHTDVAMKVLQPVDPGYGARNSDSAAFKAASHKWERDPLQYACKAYCIARQELTILLGLRHPNIVPLIGVCTHPLALILQLAPFGALDLIIKDYRRSGVKINPYVIQKILLQIAKALEYLHQQRIIYRDLKSENVLVYAMPKPYALSKTSQSDVKVEVKLADYGISRAILPTGTKGFAGTEGFMAPEIIRYNGEEEYTEKVDCFSYAMFIYELVSLRQPFERQECVKDYILEGGRPTLLERDLFYPSNFLDLMVLCWSQSPDTRPSASQIVSIVSAPEFVHLVDVAVLSDKYAPLGTCLITHPDSAYFDLIIGRVGKHNDLIVGNDHGWADYRSLDALENVTTISAICLVRSFLWIADAKATIRIFTCDKYQELDSFTVTSGDETLTTIKEICFLDPIECVAILTTSGRIIFCDIKTMTLNDIDKNDFCYLCLSCAVNSNQNSSKLCELWCGQSQGYITIIPFSETAQDFSSPSSDDFIILNHFGFEKDEAKKADKLDVAHVKTENKYVWTYLYPGCMIYQWDADTRLLLHKLDCSKLLPCSESILSIGIEEQVSPENFLITSMAVIDQELIAGTTWGCIIIIEGATMRPITVFRPYEDEIRHILTLSRDDEFRTHRESSVSSISVSSVVSTSSASSSSSHTKTFPDENKYIVTIGKGYRNLSNRFVLDKEKEAQLFATGFFCILWKSGIWINS